MNKTLLLFFSYFIKIYYSKIKIKTLNINIENNLYNIARIR